MLAFLLKDSIVLGVALELTQAMKSKKDKKDTAKEDESESAENEEWVETIIKVLDICVNI